MSTTVIHLTHDECHFRFIANLEDADLRVSEYLWLKVEACHINCVEFEDRNREIALREADTLFFLLGGNKGLGYAGPLNKPSGLAYWGSR